MTLIKNASLILPGKIMRGQMLIENGKIKKISDGGLSARREIDLNGFYVAPGLIDTHIHGFNGNEEDVLQMSLDLESTGVAAFCPTLYSLNREHLLEKLRERAAVIGQEKGAKIIGLHLEGPFISPRRMGAMKETAAVTKTFLEEILAAANGKISAITAAPEVENFELLAKFCAENKILLQAGHTDATYEQMLSAKELGLKHITHLFNAMSPLNHRAPGAAGAGLTEDFSVEVIADNVHLHPKTLSLIIKAKNPQDIVLITDHVSPGSDYELKNGAWRKAGKEDIVGSAITMLDAVKNLVRAGAALENAVMAATENPARLHNLSTLGKLEEGYEARLAVFDADFNLKTTLKD